MFVYVLFRELLPVQLNTDEHNPEFCRDNYERIVRTMNESVADAMCPVSPDDFKGAPPLVRNYYTDHINYRIMC